MPDQTAAVVSVIVDTLEYIVIVILMSVIYQIGVKMVVPVPTLMETSLVTVQLIMVVLDVKIFVMDVVITPVLEGELVQVIMRVTTHVCVCLDGQDNGVRILKVSMIVIISTLQLAT